MAIDPLKRSNRKKVFLLVVAILALYIFVPSLSAFRNSFTTLRDADFAYISLGIVFWLATFLAAVMVYKLIALKPLPYGLTLLVQLASGFTNRLAPLGAGVIALNIRYLIKRGHPAITAGALVALNNILGFTGNVILLLAAIIVNPASLDGSLKINVRPSGLLMVIIASSAVVGLIFLIVLGSKLAQKIRKTIRLLVQHAYRQPGRLALALLASMALTACYVLALHSIELAFNVHLPIAQTLFILTLGVIAATITPTPGGIGGAEAGLTAALISIGVSHHQALAIALTYRFLVYWLPILPGFVCFQVALRKHYI